MSTHFAICLFVRKNHCYFNMFPFPCHVFYSFSRFVTPRQWNCGKVMFFSRVSLSVSHSVHRWGSYVTITHDALYPNHPLYRAPTLALPVQNPIPPPPLFKALVHITPLMTSGGQDWPRFEDPPQPVLTSGGYWSTYGGRVGSAYPTGMISCLLVLQKTRIADNFLASSRTWVNHWFKSKSFI